MMRQELNRLSSAKNRRARAPLSPAERTLIETINARPIMRVPVDRLRPSTGHARRHSKAKITALAASIRRSGIVEAIVVDRDLTIISGLARWLACQQLGIAEVPVLSVEHLSPVEVRALRIAMGRFPEWVNWDREQLSIELPAITAELPDLSLTEIGFSIQEVNRLTASSGNPQIDPADEVPPASGTSPITRAGDLWQLGQHLVLCGDPLAAESYERILGSTAVRLVLADPSYRAPIDGPLGAQVAKLAGIEMESGKLAREHLRELWRNIFRQIARVSIDGAIGYLFVDWGHACLIQEAATGVLFKLENHVVWLKDQSELGSFYRNEHEFVLVYKIADGRCVSNFAHSQFARMRSDVWRHAAVKLVDVPGARAAPVAMLVEVILDRSDPGDVVLDPFGGSGSTLIACEEARRRARLIEISPTCVDAIVRRWERYCGGRAVLLDSGQIFSEVVEIRSERGTAAVGAADRSPQIPILAEECAENEVVDD